MIRSIKFLILTVAVLFLNGCVSTAISNTVPEITDEITETDSERAESVIQSEVLTETVFDSEPSELPVSADTVTNETAESATSDTTTDTEAPETAPAGTTIADTTVRVDTEPTFTEPETAFAEPAEPESKRVPILMFHDLKREPGGTWSMSADNFKSTMEYILAAGFTPVDFRQLAGYVDEYADLPEKPVCITFDDGYYSNYELLLPIVTELQIPVTVFMTCGTLRPNDEVLEEGTGELYKMSLYELGVMEASPYIDIQSHTWGLHGDNVTYGGTVRDNVLPLYGESEEVYKNVFRTDCDAASKVLLEAGVWAEIVYSYPSGKAHQWAEDVIKERGYFASLTTDFDAQNIVVRGDRDSLFLLGRMNVNDDTPRWELDYYLNRK